MTETTINKKNHRRRYLSNGMLLITAILWGSGFIPQRLGADNLTPFTFNGFRYAMAGLTLLLLSKFKLPREKKSVLITSAAGVVLFLGSMLQQTGMKTTTIANTSFITAIYVALVPFLSFLLFRQKIQKSSYIAALVALIGLYLISTSGQALAKISVGDLIVFLRIIFLGFTHYPDWESLKNCRSCAIFRWSIFTLCVIEPVMLGIF